MKVAQCSHEAISMNKITISSDCPTGPREILKMEKQVIYLRHLTIKT